MLHLPQSNRKYKIVANLFFNCKNCCHWKLLQGVRKQKVLLSIIRVMLSVQSYREGRRHTSASLQVSEWRFRIQNKPQQLSYKINEKTQYFCWNSSINRKVTQIIFNVCVVDRWIIILLFSQFRTKLLSILHKTLVGIWCLLGLLLKRVLNILSSSTKKLKYKDRSV